MCYAKPGPRCSSHSSENLQVAVKNLANFSDEFKSNPSDPEIYNKYEELKQEVDHATDAYYTTKAGWETLETLIEKATTPEKKRYFERKLETGKKRRDESLKAYKFSERIKNLPIPSGWECNVHYMEDRPTVVEVNKTKNLSLFLDIEDFEGNNFDPMIIGDVDGRSVLLTYTSGSLVNGGGKNNTKLLANLGFSQGVNDRYGMLIDPAQVGLRKQESEDFVTILELIKTSKH